MKNRPLIAIVASLTLAAVADLHPASAQPANSPGNAGSTAQQPAAWPGDRPEIGTATINPTGVPPSQRNPLLTDSGAVRIGKLVGTSIYNKNDRKVGTVDDVLADQKGQLQVVVSTNEKKVVVPWSDLVFGDAKLSSDNTVLMPDAAQVELNKRPTFHYMDQSRKNT